jgi:predicted RNase H-like HicB family nuclease
MKLTVELFPSDEGFAVCVPSLPGCWSQGATKEEALENISFAVREYLEAEAGPQSGSAPGIPVVPSGPPALHEGAVVRELEIPD